MTCKPKCGKLNSKETCKTPTHMQPDRRERVRVREKSRGTHTLRENNNAESKWRVMVFCRERYSRFADSPRMYECTYS